MVSVLSLTAVAVAAIRPLRRVTVVEDPGELQIKPGWDTRVGVRMIAREKYLRRSEKGPKKRALPRPPKRRR